MRKKSVKKKKQPPRLEPVYCKGCGRCIEACPQDAIHFADSIHPETGIRPVDIDLTLCNACGLCITACPEPYGLQSVEPVADFELLDPEKLFGARQSTAVVPVAVPDEEIPLPEANKQLVIKGTHAAAIGAVLAGCRHFFGYPITPSTEGAEFMAKVLPGLGGVFVQAVSEVATVNMMYGCGGAGLRSMTFTSSPGFSLMLEGISYMIGAEIPAVFVNIMRGGPGLGNIGPEQGDIKLACRGLGHGNTHAIVLAPSTPQEMLDLTMLAFELSFKYRNPVILLGDGYLGQVTGKVTLPETIVRPGLPDWAVHGDGVHRGNVMTSIYLQESDLEAHNRYLNSKYDNIIRKEQRAKLYHTGDAEVLLIAANTPGRMARGAAQQLRARGIRAGLFRPVTLWPFPVDELEPLVARARRIVIIEASHGQLEDEMRLALSRAGITTLPSVDSVQHDGGVLPQVSEIVSHIAGREEVVS